MGASIDLILVYVVLLGVFYKTVSQVSNCVSKNSYASLKLGTEWKD